MSTEVLLNEFKEYSEHPYRVLSEYKKQGKKVIGMLPYYAPAELVVAAGMVPMGIWGSNKKTIALAKEYCATFYCTIAQLALEMLLDGTMDQLDGKPWGNLDFAGSSVGAVKGAAPARSGGGLWADIGFDCLQPGAQASDRAASSVCGAAGCGAADSPSGGCLISLWSHGSLFCRRVCTQGIWQPFVEAGPALGSADCVFPSVPLCSLAQRCSGGSGAGSRCRFKACGGRSGSDQS